MAITAPGLLLHGLLDIRHRYLRYLGGLEELRGDLDPGEAQFIKAARRTMTQDLSAFEVRLSDAVAVADQRFPLEDPGTWTPAFREHLANLTRTQYQRFDQAQQELFPHLPLERQPSADIGFFVARAFGMSATRPSHRRRFALAYGRYATWDSRVFLDGGDAVAVLPIPFAETLTPLRWPLLAHELAHWFHPGGVLLEEDRHQQLSQSLGLDALPAAIERTFDEVLSDLAAYRTCGMAYAYALAIEAHLLSQRARARDVIGFAHRLRLLGPEAAVLADLLPGEWEGEEPDLGQAIRLEEVTQVPAQVLDEVEPATCCAEVVSKARLLLAAGAPAAAVQMWPRPDVSDAAALRADPGLQKAAFLSAVDVPASDAELLEAAWLNELDRDAEDIASDLRASLLEAEGEVVERDAVQEAAGRLAKRDTALSRSLQAAAVHRWLLRWDKDIAERVDTDSIPLDAGSPASDGGEEHPESSPLSDLQLIRRLTHPDEARRLVIRPLVDPGQIGGTTVDLRLGTEWEVLRTSRFQALDPGADPQQITMLLDASVDEFRLTTGQNQDLILHPGELLLALTLEYLRLPGDIWGNLEGRSTWARLGLQVHATAGMVDCGFEGYLTLELQNTGRLPLVLSPGLRVGQMAFFPATEVLRPYDARPTAAYSEQTKARSAFPYQHEHRALHRYLSEEHAAETGGSEGST